MTKPVRVNRADLAISSRPQSADFGPRRQDAEDAAAIDWSLRQKGRRAHGDLSINALLLVAAARGEARRVADLLRRGADPNARCRIGQTVIYPQRGNRANDSALLLCLRHAVGNFVETALALIDGGARLDLANDRGELPRDLMDFSPGGWAAALRAEHLVAILSAPSQGV